MAELGDKTRNGSYGGIGDKMRGICDWKPYLDKASLRNFIEKW